MLVDDIKALLPPTEKTLVPRETFKSIKNIYAMLKWWIYLQAVALSSTEMLILATDEAWEILVLGTCFGDKTNIAEVNKTKGKN